MRRRSATFRRTFPGLIEPGLTVSDWLHQWDPRVTREEIRGLLGQMLFSGEEGLKPTKALSGGETARLLFCRLMLLKPNILILDEPTNHLDLESINALNIALQRYEGTVLLVTHDQDLLEEVGTRIWNFEHGKIEDHKGPYEEFMAHRIEAGMIAKSLRLGRAHS
jgi:ATPase subunit of ABC transporter with duplicated ATPase domains